MRRFIKMVSLLLAVTLLTGILVSCNQTGPKKEGDILVIYNDTAIFASEVQDIINYTLAQNLTTETTEEQMKIMMGEAIGTYVQFKILELDFNERGIKVDEKAVKEQYKLEKEGLEKDYEGGYKAWMEDFGVSEYFLKEEVRRYILTDMYFEEIRESVSVSEEEMKAYMNLHSEDYYNPAGYNWTMIFREVKDITDEAECAAAEAEAQALIERLQKGEITMEAAGKELLGKYTAEDGYGKAALYNGSDFTAMQSMPVIKTEEDLQTVLDTHDEVYSKRDPNADEKSEEYAYYMHYISECFEAETYYALQTLEKGQVYSKPMKSFIGYGILCLDSVVLENTFDQFEDVKGELMFLVLEEKLQAALVEHLEELHEKYNVQYLYTSL